jgi:starch synthase
VDTIQNATDETVAAGMANGFSFRDYSALALSETLERACQIYQHQQPLWHQIMETGMRQDWSWVRSAEQYSRLYENTLSRRLEAVAT